LILIEVEKDA
jgi:hypothetical protein